MVGKYTGLSDSYLSVLKVSRFTVRSYVNPISINHQDIFYYACEIASFSTLLNFSYIYMRRF